MMGQSSVWGRKGVGATCTERLATSLRRRGSTKRAARVATTKNVPSSISLRNGQAAR